MYINKLKLINFKLFDEISLDFKPGLNLIIGPNSSGKSSIIEGIFFALYGRSNRKFDDLIKFDQKVAEITLELNNEKTDKRLTIHRCLTRTEIGTLHEAFINGEKKTITEVNQYTDNIIETREIFENAYAVRQGELLRLLEMSSLKIKEFLDECFDLLDLEKAWQNMRHILQEIETSVVRHQVLIDELSSQTKQFVQLKNEYEKLEKERHDIEFKLNESQKKMLNDSIGLDEISKSLERMENAKRELIVKENEIKAIRIEQNQLIEELLMKFKKFEDKTYDLYKHVQNKNFLEVIRNIKNKFQNISDNIEFLIEKEDIQSLDKILKTIETLREYLRIEVILENISNTTTLIEDKLRDLEYRKEQVVNNLNQIKGQQISQTEFIECPICRQPISPQTITELVFHYNEERANIENEIKLQRLKLSSLRKDQNNLIDYKEYLEDFQNFTLHHIHSYQFLLQRQKQFRKEIESLESTVRNYGNLLEMVKVQKLKERENRDNYYNLLSKKKELESRLDQKREELIFLEKSLNRLAGEKKKLMNLLDYKETLEDIRQSYREIQPELRTHYVSTLTNEVNQLLKNTEMTYNILITPDYEINVIEGEEIFLSSSLSAGQQCILGLMLKLGLAKILGEEGEILLLDEPTEFLDERNCKNVFESIKKLSTHFKQIIVATHREVAKDFTDKIIEL